MFTEKRQRASGWMDGLLALFRQGRFSSLLGRYINQAAALRVYNPRISSVVFAAVLRSRFCLWVREREREIGDSGRWNLWYKSFQLIFLILWDHFFEIFLASFSGKKKSDPTFCRVGWESETERQRQRGLYVWQSRWCWRAVSRWILLSILRELFLLFSESL
jgi:hypothetical protein